MDDKDTRIKFLEDLIVEYWFAHFVEEKDADKFPNFQNRMKRQLFSKNALSEVVSEITQR